PVNINPAGAVQHRPPGIHAWHKLRSERCATRKCACRDILEHRNLRPAARFLSVPPLAQPYLAARPDLPIQLQVPNPLLAIKPATFADEFISYAGMHANTLFGRRRKTRVSPNFRDLKLGG